MPQVLFDQPFGYVLVGQFDLFFCRAGVDELISNIGTVQVAPHSCQFSRYVVVTILLGNNLKRGGTMGSNQASNLSLHRSFFSLFNICSHNVIHMYRAVSSSP